MTSEQACCHQRSTPGTVYLHEGATWDSEAGISVPFTAPDGSTYRALFEYIAPFEAFWKVDYWKYVDIVPDHPNPEALVRALITQPAAAANQAASLGAAKATTTTAASMVPFVGELMDVEILTNPSSDFVDRTLAVGSLGLSVLSGGLLPNYGALKRSANGIGDVFNALDSGPRDAARFSQGPVVGQLVDEGKVARMFANLEKRGVTVVRGEKAASVLESSGAGAAYVNWWGKPHLYFGDTITRGQLVEEFFHHGQSLRRGHAPSPGGAAMQRAVYLDEIEAQKYMIKHATRKGWTQAEIEFYGDQLKYWQGKLDNLK